MISPSSSTSPNIWKGGRKYKNLAGKVLFSRLLHSDFEDSEQPQSPEDREAERARFRLEVRPDDLEHGAGDDEAVKPVETGLEVDPRAHGPHPQQHLEDEEPEKDELGRV